MAKLDNKTMVQIGTSLAGLVEFSTLLYNQAMQIKKILEEDPEVWQEVKQHFEKASTDFEKLLKDRNIK